MTNFEEKNRLNKEDFVEKDDYCKNDAKTVNYLFITDHYFLMSTDVHDLYIRSFNLCSPIVWSLHRALSSIAFVLLRPSYHASRFAFLSSSQCVFMKFMKMLG